MKSMFRKYILAFVLLLLCTFCFSFSYSDESMAQDKIASVKAGKPYNANKHGTEQFRIVRTVFEYKKTKSKYLKQKDAPWYVKKGDSLNFTHGGKKGATVSTSFGASIAYGVGPVSFSVGTNIGTVTGTSSGGSVSSGSLVAPKSGYYRVKAYKYVQPVLHTQQYRKKNKKGKWTKWKNVQSWTTTVKSTGYTPELKRCKKPTK